ncbi:MAG: peptidylprolyl isomerase [Candidatus Dormibacteraeota bacterium]|nr:peptidylprolyl isomerase [Candidatus Dormibacteraeota bacterium]MBV9526101.1 peptidylprolyl isomerase [Candidatus Dormibacteraeota bacterium]
MSRERLAFIIGTGIVVVAAVIAIAVGVNSAGNAVPPGASPSATASASSSASASPAPSLIPLADCSTAQFGAPLAPLNPPANVHTYAQAPAVSIDTSKLYEATITTSKGAIVLCLQPSLATFTVNNFVTLARNHFYDGIPFHRVVNGFVIQGGDPNCIGNVPAAPASPTGSCGQGGPGYQFPDEPVHQNYTSGCLAMANSGPNTNGSQFFICTANDTTLPKSYNIFGHVQSGMDVALRIVQGDIMQSVTVAEQQ